MVNRNFDTSTNNQTWLRDPATEDDRRENPRSTWGITKALHAAFVTLLSEFRLLRVMVPGCYGGFVPKIKGVLTNRNMDMYLSGFVADIAHSIADLC